MNAPQAKSNNPTEINRPPTFLPVTGNVVPTEGGGVGSIGSVGKIPVASSL